MSTCTTMWYGIRSMWSTLQSRSCMGSFLCRHPTSQSCSRLASSRIVTAASGKNSPISRTVWAALSRYSDSSSSTCLRTWDVSSYAAVAIFRESKWSRLARTCSYFLSVVWKMGPILITRILWGFVSSFLGRYSHIPNWMLRISSLWIFWDHCTSYLRGSSTRNKSKLNKSQTTLHYISIRAMMSQIWAKKKSMISRTLS